MKVNVVKENRDKFIKQTPINENNCYSDYYNTIEQTDYAVQIGCLNVVSVRAITRWDLA
jgi:hypothetical protein